jgi:prepilin-type N-terminal cleavage/methylation domain-containing protein
MRQRRSAAGIGYEAAGGANFPRAWPLSRGRSAFTLIEIMVVVAIIGIIAAMGVPAIFQNIHKEGMRAAVSDVKQMLVDARTRAVLGGHVTRVVFSPGEKRIQISDAAAPAPPVPGSVDTPAPAVRPGTVTLPSDVNIDMLDINLYEYKTAESAWVNFYPNGTCDELHLVLHCKDDWQMVTLEFSTALASVSQVHQ